MADPRTAPDAARTALAWAFCVTVTALVLSERFSELVVAVVAFAAARWVFSLDRGTG